MSIRELRLSDANNMHKALQDKNNLKYLSIGHIDFSISDCERFIQHSIDNNNRNFAIVNENDDWVGTISLKNIDVNNKKAEYAIITSQAVHGTGIAYSATQDIINYAFEKLDLNKIYLNVIKNNERAIRFYKKCGFKEIGISRDSLFIENEKYDLIWFEYLKSDIVR